MSNASSTDSASTASSASPTSPQPADRRAYLVERGLEQDGHDALTALVADYVEQSQVLGDVPMAVCPLSGTRTSDLEEA